MCFFIYIHKLGKLILQPKYSLKPLYNLLCRIHMGNSVSPKYTYCLMADTEQNLVSCLAFFFPAIGQPHAHILCLCPKLPNIKSMTPYMCLAAFKSMTPYVCLDVLK